MAGSPTLAPLFFLAVEVLVARSLPVLVATHPVEASLAGTVVWSILAPVRCFSPPPLSMFDYLSLDNAGSGGSASSGPAGPLKHAVPVIPIL